MKAFVFEYLEYVSDNYHTGGGLFIVAKDKSRAKELISENEAISISDKEWEEVLTYDLDTTHTSSERVIVFPDAGCC